MLMFVWLCVMTQAFVPGAGSAANLNTTAYAERIHAPRDYRSDESNLRLIVERRTASRLARARTATTRSI